MQKSMEEGIEVLGYYPWSFMDLMSTSNGYGKRYGFVYVNREDRELKDLKRYKKDSFYWYRQWIDENTEMERR
jgi:6-phospho-beta-glucosidase